ncbi:hypothetical protein [Burkholderia phage BCSR5]|nr:hypothetical protein [Burkholderia phage BCSR5]
MQKTQVSILVASLFAAAGVNAAGSLQFVDRGNPNQIAKDCIDGKSGSGCVGTRSSGYVAVSTASPILQGNGAVGGTGGIAIGDRANANKDNKGTGDNNGGAMAIGVAAQAINNSAMAIGTAAVATGNTAIAMGRQSAATGEFSMAMGNVANATGDRSVAIGHSANAVGVQSVAIGNSAGGANDGVSQGASYDAATQTRSVGARSVAIGANAQTTGDDQIAIGNGARGMTSVAGKAAFSNEAVAATGAVSFGDPKGTGVQRQIKGIAGATDGNDAVNLNQLTAVNSSLSTSIGAVDQRVTTVDNRVTTVSNSLSTSINTTNQNVTNLSTSVDSSVKSLNTSITNVDNRVTNMGASLSTSISNIDGRVTVNEGNITNLQAADKLNVKYDSLSKDKVTLGGANGTVLSNVKAGTADTDAVNVGQLNGKLAPINTSITNINTSLSTATSNITNLQGDVKNLSTTVGGHTTQINNLSTSLNTTNQNVSNLTNVVNGHTTDIGALQEADKRNVKYDGASGFDSVTLAGGKNGTKVTNVADGALTATSKDAVNGSQLYATNQNLTNLGDTVNQIDGRVTKVEGNITSIGDKVTNIDNSVNGLKQDALQWNSTMGAYDASHGSGEAQKITNVADGKVAAGSKDAINGGQLYDAVKDGVSNGTKNAVQYDGDDHTKVTLGGVGGTTITNVKAGELSATSKDAVNGSQLFETNTNVLNLDGRVTNIDGRVTNLDGRVTKVEGDVTNVINGEVGLVQQHGARNPITVGKDTLGGVVKFNNADGETRTLAGVTAGVADTDAVNVKQLTTATGNLQNQINVQGDTIVKHGDTLVQQGNAITNLNTSVTNLGDKVTNIDGRVTTNTTNIQALQQDALQFNKTVGAYDATRGGNATKITGVAAGNVNATSTDAINGSQLYATEQKIKDGIAGDMKNVVKYTDDTHAGIALDGKGGTKITNVRAGTLSNTSTDAVNGSQLFATNNAVTNLDQRVTKNETSITNLDNSVNGLKQDALLWNKDLGAFDASHGGVASKITNVADGAVNADSKDAVNGSQLYKSIQNAGNQFGYIKYDQHVDGSINYGSITLGGGQGGLTQIHNVADGVAPTDAVNVRQMEQHVKVVSQETVKNYWNDHKDELKGDKGDTGAAGPQGPKGDDGAAGPAGPNQPAPLPEGLATQDDLGKVQRDLNGLRGDMSALKKDMNAGIASAMAVASLPQPNRPGENMVALGTATYQGAQGFAIGISRVTSNDKWVIKGAVTTNTRGAFGAALGAGYKF